MNVNDAEKEQISGDKLDAIFARQRELMEKYHDIEKAKGLLQTEDIPVNIDDHLGQARLKDFAWRVTEELGEAMNCLKNKPWKQTQMETDRTHYEEEIIDARWSVRSWKVEKDALNLEVRFGPGRTLKGAHPAGLTGKRIDGNLSHLVGSGYA